MFSIQSGYLTDDKPQWETDFLPVFILWVLGLEPWRLWTSLNSRSLLDFLNSYYNALKLFQANAASGNSCIVHNHHLFYIFLCSVFAAWGFFPHHHQINMMPIGSVLTEVEGSAFILLYSDLISVFVLLYESIPFSTPRFKKSHNTSSTYAAMIKQPCISG